MISRRRFLASLACLGAIPPLAGCDRLVHQPVAIALHTWPGYELLFLAQREGWLDAQQVRLLEVHSATDSLQALAAGKVDGAALTLDEVLKARASGMPLSVVLILDISAGADMLVVRSDIRQLAALKGRTISFEQGAVGELMLAEILRTAGLTRADVKLLPLAIGEQLDAWRHGQIDACITYEPVASQLQALQAQVLFDSRQLPDTIVDVLAIRQDVLDFRHAKAIRHAIQGHFQSLDHFTRNPQDAAYRMASHMKLRAAEVLHAYRGLVLPDAANNYRLLSGAAPALLGHARTLSAVMVGAGLLKQADDLNALISMNYLPTDFLAA